MPPQDQAGSYRLTDLRAAQPGDATLANLIELVSVKLKLCGRLAVFEYEAGREGHTASETAFRDLKELERQSFEALVVCLKRYLDEARSGGLGEAEPEAGTPPRR